MRVIIVSALIVLLDQITKLIVKGISLPSLGISFEGMRYGQSIPVLGDFFRITYIENPGMAFGITVSSKPFFAIVSLLASIAIIFYLHRARREPLGIRLPLAMILGGAVGNLIDRTFYGMVFNGAPLFHGRVVDFFDVDFIDIDILGYQLTRWPIFNIADASVTVGVVALLIVHSISRRPSEPEMLGPADPDPPGRA